MASISSAKKMWLFALTLPAICLCGAGLAEIGIGVQGERIDPIELLAKAACPAGQPARGVDSVGAIARARGLPPVPHGSVSAVAQVTSCPGFFSRVGRTAVKL